MSHGVSAVRKRKVEESDQAILQRHCLSHLDLVDLCCVTFDPREYILRRGEPVAHLLLVASGKAKVCISDPDGNQLLLCYFFSDGMIGDIELMAGVPTAFANVQAVTEMTCIGIPIAQNKTAIREDRALLRHIASRLALELVYCNNRVLTALQPTEARLCAYIKETMSDGMFREPLTEAAQLLGTSYRQLLRCLNQLCRDGIMRRHLDAYQVADLERLSQRSHDLYIQKIRQP